MKALKEVGWTKTVRYLLFTVIFVIYRLLIDFIFNLPPARNLFLLAIGVTIGNDSVLMQIKLFNLHHRGPKGLIIGQRCFIGDETMLDLYESIELEDEVTLAQRVLILTHTNVGYSDHPLQKQFPKSAKKVLIRKGSVVGAGSIILPGITVGQGSFIAAGSVVTKNVPANTLVAGVPAKIIKNIK